MATIVTPEAPVKAVKRAHTINATMARPPGIQPKKAWVSFTRRFELLLSPRIYPAKVNSGKARRIGVSAMR